MTTHSILRLAAELAPAERGDGPLTLTYGLVTATNLTASPPTISVQVDGFSAATTNVVWPMNSYTPSVDDTVICLVIGLDVVVLGTVPAA